MGSVHIGKKIKEVVDRSPFTIVELASRINKTRTVVYDIFKRDTIDSGLLLQISKVLDHDFFMYFSPETSRDERSNHPPKRDNIIKELEACKIKIAELEAGKSHLKELEKCNQLMDKLIRILEKKSPVKKPKKRN